MVSGRAASSCATGSAGTPGQGHASSHPPGLPQRPWSRTTTLPAPSRARGASGAASCAAPGWAGPAQARTGQQQVARSRRRSRRGVRRPRGRYHCAVWLTMPSRAKSASRRSVRRASRRRARARRRRVARTPCGCARTPRHCGAALDHVALLLEDEHVVAVGRRRARPTRARARAAARRARAARRRRSRARAPAAGPSAGRRSRSSSCSLPPK